MMIRRFDKPARTTGLQKNPAMQLRARPRFDKPLPTLLTSLLVMCNAKHRPVSLDAAESQTGC